jgi:hypothetical protein
MTETPDWADEEVRTATWAAPSAAAAAAQALREARETGCIDAMIKVGDRIVKARADGMREAAALTEEWCTGTFYSEVEIELPSILRARADEIDGGA